MRSDEGKLIWLRIRCQALEMLEPLQVPDFPGATETYSKHKERLWGIAEAKLRAGFFESETHQGMPVLDLGPIDLVTAPVKQDP